MNFESFKNVRMLLVLSLVTSCGLIPQPGSNPTIPTASTEVDFTRNQLSGEFLETMCAIFQPIQWSVHTNQVTKEQVLEHNAVWGELCDGG